MKKQLKKMISIYQELKAKLKDYQYSLLVKREVQSWIKQNDNKKCLIITPELMVGGALRALKSVVLLLEECGYSIIIAAEFGGAWKDIQEFSLGKIIILDDVYRKELSRNKFDLLFVNTILPYKWFLVKGKFDRKIWWIHEGNYFLKDIRDELRKVETDEIEIKVVSDCVNRAIESNGLKWKTSIMPYCLEDGTVVEQEKNEDAKIMVMCIGAIYEIKNQLEFVKAVDLLPRECLERAEFCVIGRSADDRYYDELMNLICENGRVNLINEMERERLLELLLRRCIVVSTSIEDSLPTVLAEAMAYKNIAITSDKTGFASIITDGENGYIYELHDVRKLAGVLEKCIMNYDSLDNLTEAAKMKVRSYFDIEELRNNLCI